MSSLQTFFRSVVMLATLGFVAKVWFWYGPSVGEMQTIGARVAEFTAQTWNDYWKSNGSAPGSADATAGVPAPFVPSGGAPQPIPLPPVNGTGPGTVQLAAGESKDMLPVAPALAPPGPAATNLPASASLVPMGGAGSTGGADRLVTGVKALADLGVRNQQVRPWGNGGALYRCSCDAPWPAAPNYSRHFEAVAATPEAAVDQVTAEIAAWRTSQQARMAGN
jgi:hypothetical protein